MNNAADIVSSVRKSRRLSMNSLASLANIPASTISRIESGKIEPTFAMLSRIAKSAGFELDARFNDAGSDQPFASYLERLSDKKQSMWERPTTELLGIASLSPVAKRYGLCRLELSMSLSDALQALDRQGQRPIVSSIEALSAPVSSTQSFTPIVYVFDPRQISGFEAASMRSPTVLFALPTTENVRRYSRLVGTTLMVCPEWGALDALASPGRQPDAALQALAIRKAVSA